MKTMIGLSGIPLGGMVEMSNNSYGYVYVHVRKEPYALSIVKEQGQIHHLRRLHGPSMLNMVVIVSQAKSRETVFAYIESPFKEPDDV